MKIKYLGILRMANPRATKNRAARATKGGRRRNRATNRKKRNQKVSTASVAKAIVKLEPVKYRFFGRTVSVTSAPQVLNLTQIPFKTEETPWARNSQKVRLKNLSYHFQLKPESQDYNRVRVAIFRYKRTDELAAATMGASDGAGSTICNIQTQQVGGQDNPFHTSGQATQGNTSDMSTSTPTLPWFNPRVVDVIFDKTFELQDTEPGAVWPKCVFWNQSLSIDKTLKYPMANADVAQNTINTHNYYMACWSDSASVLGAHPSLNYTFKLSFKDLN